MSEEAIKEILENEEVQQTVEVNEPNEVQEDKIELSLEEFEALKNAEDIAKDKVIRTMAEMENLRKRTEKEVADTRKYAVAKVAQDLITPLENLILTEKAIEGEHKEGVAIVVKEFLKSLEKNNITRIDPLHAPFDHNEHEAVANIPNEEHEKGIVVDVAQAGYKVGERVIKPAMVAVSAGKQE